AHGARMTGDELAALEDLDRVGGEPRVDALTDEGVVNRVKCPAHLDVMIRMHSSAELPLGIFVAPRRQGLARRPLLALQDAVPAPLALLEGLGVDCVDDFGDRSVQLREREELPVAQRPKDAPLGHENSILYGSLVPGPPYACWEHRERVMFGKFGERAVELWVVAVRLLHRRRAVV